MSRGPAAGTATFVPPAFTGGDPRARIDTVASSVQRERIGLYDVKELGASGSGTAFDGAVSTALATLAAAPAGPKWVMFLSDGQSGIDDTVLEDLGGSGVRLRSFAIGSGATCSPVGGSLAASVGRSTGSRPRAPWRFALRWKPRLRLRHLRVALAPTGRYAGSAAAVPEAQISACKVSGRANGWNVVRRTTARSGSVVRLLDGRTVEDRTTVRNGSFRLRGKGPVAGLRIDVAIRARRHVRLTLQAPASSRDTHDGVVGAGVVDRRLAGLVVRPGASDRSV